MITNIIDLKNYPFEDNGDIDYVFTGKFTDESDSLYYTLRSSLYINTGNFIRSKKLGNRNYGYMIC